jgi:hypothetical protein
MPSPEYLKDSTREIEALSYDYSEETISIIAAALAGLKKDMSEEEVREFVTSVSGQVNEDVLEKRSSYSGMSEAAIRKAVQEAGEKTIRENSEISEAAGLGKITQNAAMEAAVNQMEREAVREAINLTGTTAISSQEAFISAANQAYQNIRSGNMSYGSAVASAIKEAAKRGTLVYYPSGHRDKIEVAMRRTVLSAVNKGSGEMTLLSCQAAGCEYVETTAHSGARPSHAVWQGRVFKLNGSAPGYDNFYEATGYGTGAGLCGWNCRHSFYMFFPGISAPAYSRSMLRDYEERKFEWNGTKYTDYECAQIQRGYERKIRESRRTLIGYESARKNAADESLKEKLASDFQNESVRLKRLEKEMREFCKETGRYVDSSRLFTISGDTGNADWFTRSISQKAVHANKAVTNPLRNGIIKTDKQFGKKIGKHAADFGLDPSKEADRKKMNRIIDDIVGHADEIRVGTWRGQTGECRFYIKGTDVVVANGDIFVTILKGGLENSGRVKNARKL